LTQQALAKVGAGVDVLGIPLKGRAIAGLRLIEFALLEVNVSQLEMMMGLVEGVDLRLEMFDEIAVVRAGRFEAAGQQKEKGRVQRAAVDGARGWERGS